jgi:hypothetical protein
MNLSPLISVSRTIECSLPFLLGGLLLLIPVFCCIDLPIFILLLLCMPLLCESRSETQDFEASMQMYVTTNRPITILGFFMVIFSTVLMSLTPS